MTSKAHISAFFVSICIAATVAADEPECVRNFAERGAMLVGQRWSTSVTVPTVRSVSTVRDAIVDHLKSGAWRILAADDSHVDAQQTNVGHENPSIFSAVMVHSDGGLRIELAFRNAPMISVQEQDVKRLLCAVAETARLSGASQAKPSESAEQRDLVVEDILAHNKMVVQAIFKHDIDFLDKHIADEAIYTANGKESTKRMFLASVMEAPVVTHQVKLRYSDVNSTTTEDIIEVTATTTMSVYVRGRWLDAYEGRGTGRYRKVDGEWISVGGTTIYEKKLK